MSGYQWSPPKKQPDPATVIAALIQDKHRLQQEVDYWKHQARQRAEHRS